MGTSNYQTQKNFDLYVTEYIRPYKTAEEAIKDGAINDPSEFEAFMESDEELFYYDTPANFDAELGALLKGRELKFHELILKGGYYFGAQMFVKRIDELPEDTKDWTNDDTQYYFDLSRSKAIRAFEAEERLIRKLMAKIANNLGFEKLHCVGRFSNGEALYEKAS